MGEFDDQLRREDVVAWLSSELVPNLKVFYDEVDRNEELRNAVEEVDAFYDGAEVTEPHEHVRAAPALLVDRRES